MADNKSCEENILYQCINCQRHRVIRNGVDGNTCNYCDGYLNKVGPTNLATSKEAKKCRSMGEITTKLSIDCSDALTGLKAIQREAKKATAALKELEEQKKNKYLVIELDELGDVPKVIYKGKEITAKEFVNFQWTTKSQVPGYTDIILDYFEKDNTGYPKRKSIREGVSS